MAKYKHLPETVAVLDDISNRITQLMEVNAMYAHIPENAQRVKHQNRAFESVLVIVKQVKDNGNVFRGNDYFPDPIEPLVDTKWSKH